jgi:hypothetical protein
LEFRSLSLIETIEFLHRGEGAAVTFHRKVKPRAPDEKPWEELGATTLPTLRRGWLSIAEHLHTDAYFSINSTYEQARCTNIAAATGLPLYSRRASSLRWLNSAVLDVDIYKIYPDCSRADALQMFLAEITRRGLPEPSLISFSGRGFWALWMLRDHKNFGSPVPAHEDRRDIYQRVNQALVQRFTHLGADRQSTDPARVMRVPGSVNSSAAPENSIVEFFRLGDDTYTLPELAQILEVTTQKVPLPGERTKPKNVAKVNAGRMRWRRPLEGFQQLWRMRVQFAQGVRHYAVLIYALLLRRNRIPETEVLKQCSLLAESCSPVLPASDVARCLNSSRNYATRDFSQSISNATIARMLKITAEEKLRLSEWFKPELRRKADEIAERRRLIARELRLAEESLWDWKDSFSSRDMAKLLVEKYGIRITHATVLEDFRTLKNQPLEDSTPDPSTGKFPLLKDSKSLSCTSRKNLPAWERSGDWASKGELSDGTPINCAPLRNSRWLKHEYGESYEQHRDL